MKIQLALDRVTLQHATDIIDEAYPYIDIIEIGTSLMLDYGIEAVKHISKNFDKPILVDFKTMDEPEYEFRKIFSSGADFATVMGAASLDTIRVCQKIAQSYGKSYVIDVMELPDEKVKKLAEFEDAIIALHLPMSDNVDFKTYINKLLSTSQLNNRLAAAGGITLNDIQYLKKANIEIAIVGSAITKSDNIQKISREFKRVGMM